MWSSGQARFPACVRARTRWTVCLQKIRLRAKTEDRPGVTRSKQWVPIDRNTELLDTPGILWPKFDDQSVGMNLAYTGAVKDDILDVETLG